MIILEGPDNSGKTTLANQISGVIGFPVVHAGGPCKTPAEKAVRVFDCFNNCSLEVIQDRNFIISDQVYNLVLNKVRDYNIFPLEYKLRTVYKPFIIYCRPSDKILFDFTNHKVKDHETKEHVNNVILNQSKIVAYYDALMPAISYCTYNFEEDSLEDLIKTIKIYLENRV